MNYFKKGEDRDEKIDIFLDAAGWWYSEKNPSPNSAIMGLSEEIKKAGESSDNLTAALNKLSLYGLWIAGAGVGVAFLTFIFEAIQFFSK